LVSFTATLIAIQVALSLVSLVSLIALFGYWSVWRQTRKPLCCIDACFSTFHSTLHHTGNGKVADSRCLFPYDRRNPLFDDIYGRAHESQKCRTNESHQLKIMTQQMSSRSISRNHMCSHTIRNLFLYVA